MPRASLVSSVCCIVCMALLHASIHTSTVLAKPSDDEPAPPAGYTQVLRDALAESEAENWPEAKALFEKAHALYPNARTLRGLGMVAFAARRYVDSIDYLRSALAHEVRPLTEAQRAHAQGLINQSNTFVGRFTLALTPSESALLVDGKPARFEEPGVLILDPGEHELVASAPEHVESVRKLSVSGGEQGTVTIELRPVANEAATPATPLVLVQKDAAKKAPEDAPARLWTWVALGSAGAFGVAALAFHLNGQGENQDIIDECRAMDGGECTPKQKRDFIADSSIGAMDVLTNLSLGLAGASLVTAGVLFLAEGGSAGPSTEQEPEPAKASARLQLSPTGVQVYGTF